MWLERLSALVHATYKQITREAYVYRHFCDISIGTNYGRRGDWPELLQLLTKVVNFAIVFPYDIRTKCSWNEQNMYQN